MKRTLTKSVIALSLASMLAMPLEAAVKKNSFIMYCSTNRSWSGESMQGFYTYPFTGDGSAQRIGSTIGMTAFWGAPVGNKYYLCCGESSGSTGSYDAYYLVTLDRATLEEIDRQEVNSELVANDVAVDPVSGRIYGLFLSGDGGYVWGYVDPVEKTRTKISDYTVKYNTSATTIDQFRSLCFSPDGQAYAVPFSGKLYKVDKETGEVTNMGFTKYYFNYVEGATWDNENDRVLTTYSYSSTSALNAINPADGKMTTLANLPGAVTVIYNPYDYVQDKSPLPVSNLTVSFENGSKDGTVSFTAPTTTEDGTTLSETLTYYIVNKGETVATGTVEPGKTVSEAVTASSSELMKYSVYTTDAAGESLREVASAFAGVDKPAAPNVTATNNGSKVTLTWNAVNEGAQGGYVNADKMTYDVKRYPGGKLVASAITGTTFTDEVALPEEGKVAGYHYGVTARSGGLSSAEGESKKVMLGALMPEWTENFSSESALDNFTIINAGNSGNTWKWNDYRKCAYIEGSNNYDKNDWLISPPVELKKGLSYDLVFDFNTGSYYNQKYELCIGTDNTVEAMTKKLDSETLKYSGKPYGYTSRTVTINVENDGIYYIGWHAKTTANDENIYIDNINLKAGVSPDVPGKADNFAVTPDNEGRLTATVSFTMPVKTMEEKPITDKLSAKIYRDGKEISCVDDKSAGDKVSITDNVEKSGSYTYKVVIIGANGESAPMESTVFVGNNKPLGANRPKAVEDPDEPGMVTLSWTPTATDVDGRNILPETLGYKIIRLYDDGKQDTLATVKGVTEYTYKECDTTTPQYMIYYELRAFNDYGMANIVSLPSLAICVGASYEAPYIESFKGKLKVPMATNTLNGWSRNVVWEPVAESTYPSQDGDGYFVQMRGEATGNSASLTTGKISLKDLKDAQLTFWVYKHNDTETNQIETLVGYNGIFTSMDITTMDQLETGWNKVTIDLSDYAGKAVAL